MCMDEEDNELEVLEIIHHFVEILDRYFGSVSSVQSFDFWRVLLYSPMKIVPFFLGRI